MNKAKEKKMTLNDFIVKAKKKEKSKKQFREIEMDEGVVVATKVDDGFVLDLMDKIDEDISMKELVHVYKELIYESVPLMQKKELHKEFELIEPYDIVTKVFEIGEIITLSNKILKFHGINDFEDDLKN